MSNKVTVIMGIYNCAGTIAEALDSLLAQTYTNWNLIMCDDGSNDGTYTAAKLYLEKYPDKMTLIRNNSNIGLNRTLNRCLKLADGDYIARMDGDDISLPERFEKEAAALDSNPSTAIVSTPIIYFDEDGKWGAGQTLEHPQKLDFLHGTPFCHAPCMVRREAFEEVNGYCEDDRYLRVEDYELWVRMYARGYRGINLDEALYLMRDDQNAASRRKYKYRINEFRAICKAVELLRLPAYGYVMALRPLVVGMLPRALYKHLHKRRLRPPAAQK